MKAKRLRQWAKTIDLNGSVDQVRHLTDRERRTVRRALGIPGRLFELHPSGKNRATRRKKAGGVKPADMIAELIRRYRAKAGRNAE